MNRQIVLFAVVALWMQSALADKIYSQYFSQKVREEADKTLVAHKVWPVPAKLKSDYDLKIDEAVDALNRLKTGDNRNYVSTKELEDTTIRHIMKFVETLNSLVRSNELQHKVNLAVEAKLKAAGYTTDMIPSELFDDYMRKGTRVYASMNALMRRDGRDYVRTSELDAAVAKEMKGFTEEIQTVRSRRAAVAIEKPGWATLLVDVLGLFASMQDTQPEYISYANPPATPTPSAPVHDANKIWKSDLDSRVVTEANAHMHAMGIDKIPGPVQSHFNTKVAEAIKQLNVVLEREARPYVYLSEVENVLGAQLAPVVERMNKMNGKTNMNYHDETCVICQENFESRDHVVHLNCGHIYHEGCAKQWMTKHHDCPECRQKVEIQTHVVVK
jgi:hypothetical protein